MSHDRATSIRFASTVLAASRLRRAGCRFADDERGVTAIIFAIMFTFLFLMAAIAVDYSRATKEVMEEQAALDAAILAASKELGTEDEAINGPARAEQFFAANMPASTTAELTVSMNGVTGEVVGSTSNAYATTLLKSRLLKEARTDHFQLGATARVVKGGGTVEIALVVDNSGSMAGTYIEDLKTAAGNLVDKVMTGAEGDKVKVGVVPFATSVNVGAGYQTADWMDQTSTAPSHSENFSETKSRFDLFTDLGIGWAGCVEARPTPYDVSDAAPDPNTPATLFVPMFAPDEPDDVNAEAAGHSYSNNYISDFEGTCPAPEQVCIVYNRKKQKCTSWGPAPIDVAEAQSRVCKYSGAPLTGGTGPNYGCSTAALLPLSNNKVTIHAAIDSLTASGNTNIGEGTMWGFRVLSPTAPFTDGRAYSDTENRKVLVIMTDGANTYSASSNHNKSRYGAFGYGVKERLGTTFSSSAYSDAMDVKLQSACAAAKAEDITIFTVAFRLEDDPDTQALLQGCATDADHAYTASSGSALIQAFENIGGEISQLRVAE